VVCIIGGILGQLCEPRTKPRLDYARMENVPKRTKDGLLVTGGQGILSRRPKHSTKDLRIG
jgi:hypothetical protein